MFSPWLPQPSGDFFSALIQLTRLSPIHFYILGTFFYDEFIFPRALESNVNDAKRHQTFFAIFFFVNVSLDAQAIMRNDDEIAEASGR